MIYDLIIIGGGASGLFAAANAPEGKILLLEKMDRIGKKILISGGGMCNLTNCDEPEHFIQCFGSRKKSNFLKPSLFALSPDRTAQWLESRGFHLTTREDGKKFPRTLKAQSLVNFLEKEALKKNVEIKRSCNVESVRIESDLFLIKTGSASYRSRSVLITTGGKSFPSTGSDGSGYVFARELGHKIIDLSQALASVYIEEYQYSHLSGSSLKNISVDFYHGEEGKRYLQSKGDLLFTHNGVSGPVILNNSRFVRNGDRLDCCLIEGENRDLIREKLLNAFSDQPNKNVKNLLRSLGIFSALAETLMNETQISHDVVSSSLNKKKKNKLISKIIHFPLRVSRKASFASAMATAGGVDLSEVDRRSMESKKVPRLYFAGEVLDIDGDTGGYNIQAAFSTAYCAVQNVSSKIDTVETSV